MRSAAAKVIAGTMFCWGLMYGNAAYSCDVSDGRWVNCPENRDDGTVEDPLFPVGMSMFLGTPYNPTYPTCQSTTSERVAYAQMGANGIPVLERHWWSYLRIQYNDRSWQVYDFNSTTGEVTLALDMGWALLSYQIDDGGLCERP